MLLSNLLDPATTNVESSKGNFGVSYEMMFNKVIGIFKATNPMNISHVKAGRLLHIVHDIIVKDNKFHNLSLGGLELLVVSDRLDADKRSLTHDIAQLDSQNIIFIFKDNIINDYCSNKEIFSNLYTLYDFLVTVTIMPGMCCDYYTIYSAIARYAPYVLTVKTMLALGYRVSFDDIDFDVIPCDNSTFIDEETLDIVKTADAEDLLSYGILCDYANKK